MRIAQVSPLIESVPPKYYGGIERVVAYLTEDLVARGHEVTLFASGDSHTSAALVTVVDEALRLGNIGDPPAYHLLLLEELVRRHRDFDIIHCHLSFEHFCLTRHLGLPVVTTQHGRLDLASIIAVFQEYHDMPLVSISNQQRSPVADANWIDTVYNGIPADLFTFNNNPDDYLVFLGRASPEKGLHTAIEIAEAVGMNLKIASKVDRADQEYFDNRIKPMLQKPRIEFVGEVVEQQKNQLLGNARAMLFPIDWPEPFGLVMIEAMACGTPVIAFPGGSVPEVIDHGKTGLIVENVDAAVQAISQLDSISRQHCRDVFEQRFTVQAMTDGYLDTYNKTGKQSGEY